MSKTDRRLKLSQRLALYKMKEEMADIVMKRENGVWEAILCMNSGKILTILSKLKKNRPSSGQKMSFENAHSEH